MPQKDPAKKKAWEKKIKAWQDSGLSAEKWCLENGENYHKFKYWRQALKTPMPLPVFKELREEEVKLDIELSYGELKVHFPNGCTTSLLEMCLKSMKKAQCFH